MLMARLIVGVGLVVALSSCSLAPDPHRRLTRAEAGACHAKGGFEGRSAFGAPICQFAYADAGKACTGQADCRGRCRSAMPADNKPRAIGTPAVGQCQAFSYDPDCSAVVENGKLATTDICED